MKLQTIAVFFLTLILLGCSSSPNLKEDHTIPLTLPIQEHDYASYVVALAADGKIWQWQHSKGNKISNIQQLDIDDVHSVGVWEKQRVGWALKNNGIVINWVLNDINKSSKFDEKKPVKKVVTSNSHMIHLYTNGTLGFLPSSFGNPRAYSGFTSMENIIDVAAGSNFSIACTKEGNVYVTGENNARYIARVKQDWIDNAHQISELKNIVKIGITPYGNRYYAIDNEDNLYFWGLSTYEQAPYNIGRKAIDLITGQYLLEKNGIITEFWRKGPRTGIIESIDFREENPDFKDAIYYRGLSKKESYLVIDGNGHVSYFNQKIYWSGNTGKARPENPVKIEGLTLDLKYFENNITK